ncbi:MAG: diaminopimelate epimerase [Ileibacterium sp.]|nr:diaminopimelate epimerase [Ileibacterium sp.]
MQLFVSKYHGCGNDFIILRHSAVEDWNEEQLKDFIVSVCDRHTGIGADGCIFVNEDPLEMIYYNQDGSRADMCGNGIRCFAAYCSDEGLEDKGLYDVQTLAGTKTISVISKDPFYCQIAMGKPDWDPKKIKTSNLQRLWNSPISTPFGDYEISSFYMSTIHTVLFEDEPFADQWAAIGEAIGKHPLFEEQTNVNFVKVLNDHEIEAATWERGCGMTLACGTGMCASALCALLQNKTGPHVDVHMKKGTLHIDIEKDQSVYLSGPAVKIMEGIYEYEQKESA